MKNFITNNRNTLISLAVIFAVFCVSVFLTAIINEYSPIAFGNI